MKKVIKNLIFTVVFVFALNLSLTITSSAKTSSAQFSNSEKTDIIVVRTTEDGVNYIEIYTDSGILIMKVAEL